MTSSSSTSALDPSPAEPAAGLFHERGRALAAARELASRGVRAVVRDGMREAEHGFLLQMAVGGLIGGVLMAIVGAAFSWWMWPHAEVLPLAATILLLTPPIAFCGVYVGVVVGLSLGERAVSEPEVLLVVPGEEVAAGKVDPETVDSVIRAQGGEPIKGSRLRPA
jgi:hypothetical protein